MLPSIRLTDVKLQEKFASVAPLLDYETWVSMHERQWISLRFTVLRPLIAPRSRDAGHLKMIALFGTAKAVPFRFPCSAWVKRLQENQFWRA
jgi:hypothetical protein